MKATALVALLALGAEGLALEEALSRPRELPPVPEVFNAGADGMPQLPEVATLLADYTNVKHNLNSQASDFAAHLSQVEHASVDRIAKAKASFDAKLRAQEKLNQAVLRDNAHLAKEILVARQKNAELKEQVKKEEKLVSFRRTELKAMEQELAKSEKFAHNALADRDATKNSWEDLSFLHLGKAPAKTLDASAEPDEVSFLEVSRKHHIKKKAAKRGLLRSSSDADDLQLPLLGSDDDELSNITGSLAEDGKTGNGEEDKIIDDLTNDLRQLHKAEKLSTSKLVKMFRMGVEAGKRRHVALIEQTDLLKKELEHTTAITSKLQKLLDDLKGKQTNLEGALQQEGRFFKNMEKVALASARDVPALLKAVSDELPAN